MNTFEEAQLIYKDRVNELAFLESCDAVLLGDASTSAPNIRGSEIILASIFARRLAELPNKPDVITTLYSAKAINGAIQNTPYNYVLVSSDPELQRRLSETQVITDNTFVLNLESEGAKNFVTLFGDPQMRINNILLKGLAKMQETGDEQHWFTAIEKARKFLGALSATLFTNSSGATFPEVIVQDRLVMTSTMSDLLYPEQESTEVILEEVSKGLYGVTLRDLQNVYPEDIANFTKNVAFTCTCPECSLSSTNTDDEGATQEHHAIGFDGEFYKNSGALASRSKPYYNCSFLKKLKENLDTAGLSILDLPLGFLVDCGFKSGGKLIYLTEAFSYQNPAILNAVRDYSEPRGTVELSMRIWDGLSIITPRVYVQVTEGENVRDANGYEVMEFINSGGADTLRVFAEHIPMLSDQRKYVLNLTTGGIEIT